MTRSSIEPIAFPTMSEARSGPRTSTAVDPSSDKDEWHRRMASSACILPEPPSPTSRRSDGRSYNPPRTRLADDAPILLPCAKNASTASSKEALASIRSHARSSSSSALTAVAARSTPVNAATTTTTTRGPGPLLLLGDHAVGTQRPDDGDCAPSCCLPEEMVP